MATRTIPRRGSGAREVRATVDLELFSQQLQFLNLASPYSAFIGGVGSGKTRAGIARLLIYVSRHSGALVMVTAPTFPMLRDATLRTALEIFPPGIFTMHRTEMRMVLANGSEILWRSTDDPEVLRGPNLAAAYMDEAAGSKEDAFLILQGRLRQAGFPPQLWLTTTPKGYNWVYRTYAQHQRPDYQWVQVSARENPYLSPDFIARLEESYRDDFALQEIEGQFVVVGGQMYFDVSQVRAMLEDCQEPLEERLGAVRIWKPPVVARRYVLGGDCAWGETGSYSASIVLDWQTGEQVAEVYGRPPLEELAKMNVDLARSYNDAYALVEANGEGQVVVDRMAELGYGGRMYRRPAGRRGGQMPYGWHTDATTRPVMLAELEEAVRMQRVRLRCREAVDELLAFVRDDKGRPGPSEGAKSDHVMALALAWQARKHATWKQVAAASTARLW